MLDKILFVLVLICGIIFTIGLIGIIIFRIIESIKEK